MGILYDEGRKLFKLDTADTTYLIGLSPEGYVGHVYYGKLLENFGGAYLLRMEEAPFTPAVNKRDKSAFLDSFPMEYSTEGVGDFRESCLSIRGEHGGSGCEIFYRRHEIQKGKPALCGLPASFGSEDEVQTLRIICEDPVLQSEVVLSYSVFEKENVITRNVLVENKGTQTLFLEKVFSACLDMDNQDFEMLTLCGAWARERHIQRRALSYGKQSVASGRMGHSHQAQPFMALVTPGTTQETGEVYGMHFVYSGNYLALAERTQFDQVRMVMGIHPDTFQWKLEAGERFQAPEAVLVYSCEGLGKMSRSLHDFYREHLIRSPYKYEKRPVLINNWEATYFQFNEEKLLAIAKEAQKNGIEMLVLDDGWFGKRNDDNSSLGDWFVNTEKLPDGIGALARKVNALGMKFGIWFEPEMVSPDSQLYRAHPDWAIQLPDREPAQIRAQYILDISRKEVRDYVYESVAAILRSGPIDYVKWDMNRNMCDMGSAWLPADRQKELCHRYVLGVYELQERLITEFPNLLLENCSGGGGRFDPGMLYYSPQIWCSDDMDALERLRIQEGTALLYPLSAMGAHIGDCPNHSVGRNTPFETRGHVALAGTFGYELDITKISEEERAQIPGQVAMCKKYQGLVQSGDYYRLASWSDEKPFDCWEVAAKDGSEALVTWVQVLGVPNVKSRKIYLRGLESQAVYRLEDTGETFTGEELQSCGFLTDKLWGDFRSKLYHFVRI